jgi:hypothetical protein
MRRIFVAVSLATLLAGCGTTGTPGIGGACAKLGPALRGITGIVKDRQARGGVLSPSEQQALTKFQQEATEAKADCARKGLVTTVPRLKVP